MKTILIIGANAAIARAVIPVLVNGSKVIAAGRSGCDLTIDVTKEVVIPPNIDVVINFAASFGGDGKEGSRDALNTNVLGTLKVCQAAKAAGTPHVIIISTIFAELNESSPWFNMYALSKKLGDEVAQFYCKKNSLVLTCLRPSRVYGDSDSFAKNQPFLYQLIDTAEKGENALLYGTNNGQRNYLHVSDLAEILKLVVQKQVQGLYSCVQPTDTSYAEIADLAYDVFSKGGQLVRQTDKPDIDEDSFKKDLTLYEKIGFNPAVSIQEGIVRIKDFKERAQL